MSSLDDKNPLPSQKMTAIPTGGSTGNDNTNQSISTIGMDSGMNKAGGPAVSYDFGTVLDLNSLWAKELSGGNN